MALLEAHKRQLIFEEARKEEERRKDELRARQTEVWAVVFVLVCDGDREAGAAAGGAEDGVRSLVASPPVGSESTPA